MLGRYWAWTKTDGFKNQMRPIVAGRRFPEGQLPLHRTARSVDADADQHLQPDRDQRDRRQHLGQLFLSLVQGAAVGRHGQSAPSAHRRGVATSRCPAADAASRVRLRSSAPGPPRRSCRTTASARSIRARRSRRACACSRPRSSRCSGRRRRREGPDLRERHRPGRRRDRSHDGRQHHLGAGRLRARRPARSARHRASASSRFLVKDGSLEIGPIPKGTPVGLLANLDCSMLDDLAGTAARSP